MKILKMSDLDLAGKRVFIRADLNVPQDDSGKITDDTRIRASMPTIYYLLENGAAVILMSHLGRPKGKPNPKYSLAPVAAHLQELLGAATPVKFAPDCVGPEVREMAYNMQTGEVLLLENLRFHPEEEANDPDFARQLADLADLYVDDAFGSSHRAHASTEGVAHYLPAVAGMLMERELAILGAALDNSEHPFVAILGGAKVSDKIGVISNLLNKVDTLIIGGGMANTFLKAFDYQIGDSLVENDLVKDAEALTVQANLKEVPIMLPTDVVIGDEFSATANHKVVEVRAVPELGGWRILDIGPKTAKEYAAIIRDAKTVVWNGPMGVFEMEPFAAGTRAVAQAMADATENGATTIVGGGDSVAAVEQMGLAGKVTHISTGGGASLEFLEGRELPGVAALNSRK